MMFALAGRLLLPLGLLLVLDWSSAWCADLLGEWQTEGNEARVRLYRCDTVLCGTIVWLRNTRYTDSREGPVGSPIVDAHNPDPALRGRPVLGLRILQGFTEGEGGIWRGGTVYDPKTGKTYRGTITVESPDRLVLRGYVGIPLFGRSSVWTR